MRVVYLKNVGDTRLVDITAHKGNCFKGLSEATIRFFGWEALVAVIHDYTAGDAERPHVRQSQEGARPFQIKSCLGY